MYVEDGAGIWYKSDDAGQSWEAQNFPVNMLALDAVDPNWLYGISLRTMEGDVGKRSMDGGLNWNLWNEMPCQPSLDDKQLMAHPTQHGVLFLGCNQGLYRSLNGGDNWQQLSTTSGQFLKPDYGQPGRILWAKDNELWASVDEGSTWDPLFSSWDQMLTCSVFLPHINR